MNWNLAALQFISRSLADDPRPKAILALKKAIRSGRLPWESVVALANNHLLAPALWVALQKKGLSEELPEELHTYLRELHQLSRERNARLRIQLLEAVQQLNKNGISPVLLKGAMHLVANMYGDTGARIMSDIDILVPEDETETSMNALKELGYQTDEDKLDDYPEHHHHCPPLFRPGDYASLEIHRELMEAGAGILPANVALAKAESLEFDGHSMKVLSPTHRALHNIVHSQVVDSHYANGIIPLRSLYEVVTENAASSGRVDWSEISHLMEQHNKDAVLQTYLYMAYRLFGMPLPAGFRIDPQCHWYFARVRAQLAWRWFDGLTARLNRLSESNMRQLYGCDGGWLSLNLARMKHIKRKFFSYVGGMMQSPRSSN